MLQLTEQKKPITDYNLPL
uniref:Uncharacterized protein n=1 Tax=Anguilla anguilla TaxID=7936 RepID=A0A0E9Q9R1_ANGAN